MGSAIRFTAAASSLLLLASCAAPIDPDLPFAESFLEAEAAYGVPRAVLVGVASTETGLVHQADDGEDSHGQRCYGVMGLCAEGTLERAAELLRVPVETVRTDPRANVLGAAAVLAEYRRQAEKGGLAEALRRYGGRGSAQAGEIFLREVARYASADLPHVPRVDEARPDSSLARWVPSPNYRSASRGASQIRKIVIHTTQGSYSGAISWFQNPRSQVSAHYVIRSRDGEITQMVEEKDVAWHVACWNGDTIGIEHEGWVNDPGTWYTEAMYRRSAALVREIARRYGIPLDRSHILGHGEVSHLSGGCTTHTDPGSGWDWSRYMAYVREGSGGGGAPAPPAAPATGVLRGVIYDAARPLSDPGNRLSGVTVRLSNGAAVVTGSSGAYVFRVPPGRYTVTASLGGWTSASATRTVTASQDTWGSIGLRATALYGRYVGVVYDAARPASQPGNRVSGVTVRLSNGMSTTTNGSGYFSFRVPVGTYTATASKAGWQPASTTRSVSANAEIWGSIGLRR